jgi:ubiquinone/menaquinone biosynthesis C-methylase UbiE
MTEATFLHTTRVAYDTVAANYAQRLRTSLADMPLDRALLAGFAELVQAAGNGPVVDVGCGPGHVTAHLRGLGLTISGIDLSPAMVALARQAYPDLRFDEGSMTALDLPDNGLAGIVAHFSIIHIPPDQLPGVFAEFHRVLAPGGQLLLVFQVGDEQLHLTQAYGHPVTCEAYRLPPDRVAAQLGDAGLVIRARAVCEPEGLSGKVPRAFLFAGKPADTSPPR